MTKIFAALCAVLVALPLLAEIPETIIHDVQRDRIVRKGVVRLTTKNITSENFTMEIKYKIFAKYLWIEKDLEGEATIDLPIRFLSPYGYQELQEMESVRVEKAILTHLGTIDLPNHYDCHKVKIQPTENKKWSGVFTYCPDIPSIGFARTKITMKEIPFLKTHTVYSRIRE